MHAADDADGAAAAVDVAAVGVADDAVDLAIFWLMELMIKLLLLMWLLPVIAKTNEYTYNNQQLQKLLLVRIRFKKGGVFLYKKAATTTAAATTTTTTTTMTTTTNYNNNYY